MSFPVLRYFLDIFIFQVLSLSLSLSLSLTHTHTHTHTCIHTFAIAIRLLIPEEELVGCVLWELLFLGFCHMWLADQTWWDFLGCVFVFQKLARQCIFPHGERLMKKSMQEAGLKKLPKFTESAWKLTYYAVAETLLLLCTAREPWFGKTKYFWINWPYHMLKYIHVPSSSSLQACPAYPVLFSVQKHQKFRRQVEILLHVFAYGWIKDHPLLNLQ